MAPISRPGLLFFGSATSNTGAGVALQAQGCHQITVKAAITNTGVLYVGGSTVDANAYDLQAGESITLAVTDASLIYHMASVDAQKIEWIGVT